MAAPVSSSPVGRSPEAGFTLIELLVALAVLGLAAGLLATSLGGAWAALPLTRQPQRDESVIAAQRIIRARIERMTPVVRMDSTQQIVDARGYPRQFSFPAPPLDRAGPGALQRFRLMLTSSGDLVLFSASGLDGRIDLNDPSLVGWQATRLLGGVRDIDISYYGPDRLHPEERWQAFWLDRAQPPALIRVRLNFAAGDRRRWPDLIVRPRATVNAVCRISRASGRCEAV